MKKLLAFLLFSTSVYASQGEVFFGIGQGDKNISWNVGFKYKNIGANVFSSGNYDYSRGEVNPNPPPHTMYIREDNKKVGSIVGLNMTYFLSYKSLDFFAETGLGIREYRDLAISTNDYDRGNIYTLSREKRLKLSYGIGANINIKNFLIGINLNNLKGILVNVGVGF